MSSFADRGVRSVTLVVYPNCPRTRVLWGNFARKSKENPVEMRGRMI